MSQRHDAPVIPGFTFVKHIGSGGFADVFLFEQHLPARKVAVKVLAATAPGEAVLDQFQAEANVMAQLSGHSAIVAIHAADVSSDSRPYIVMEYCPPPTLASRYRTERISPAEALETGIRIAGAVETVHRAGILHRDVKPHNILTSNFGAPKLTDFGIAGAASSEVASYGMSVPWSPPESFLESPPNDVRVDVWALAATVYSLLAGRSPFEVPGGANDNATLMSRIERSPAVPLTRPDVPDSLNRVLLRAMSKDMAGRHDSALALAKDLQDVQAELGLPQTRVEVFDASPTAPATVEEDQRTQIKPVSIIVPDALAQGTLLSPKVIRPEHRTLAKLALAPGGVAPAPAPVVDADLPVAVASTVDDEAPARSRWGFAVAAVAALVILGGGAAAVVLDGGDDAQPRAAFNSTEAPVDAVADFIPVPTDLTATASKGAVTFSWNNPDPSTGDRFGVEASVADRAQPLATVRRESLMLEAPAGQIVCVTVRLFRSSGAASEPTQSVCREAR
jgi:hypothetical protein